MELTFLENDGKWIAEFKVDKEFNLHIEREDGTGKIKMYQNSATGGKYAIVEDFAINNNYKPVLDFSSGYFVGEKSIKIVSEVLPTYAAITTDGDVVEIKSQSKVVEITSNGTTSVEPDAGFSYLSKVDVKVDVPQNGGGGDTIKYIDPSKSQLAAALVESATLIKLQLEDGVIIVPMSIYIANQDNYNLVGILGASVDLDAEFVLNPGGQLTSVRKNLNGLGITDEQINSIPYITEEEFYNLES